MKWQREMHQGSHVPRPSLIPVLFTIFPHQKERHWCLCPCPWSGWSCPSSVSRCWSEKTVFSKKRHEQATSRAKSKVKWNKIGLYLFGDKTHCRLPSENKALAISVCSTSLELSAACGASPRKMRGYYCPTSAWLKGAHQRDSPPRRSEVQFQKQTAAFIQKCSNCLQLHKW